MEIIFRNAENSSSIVIQACYDDKIRDIIQRYRFKSGDNDPSLRFIYCAKQLNPDLTVEEAGICNNSNIFVCRTKKDSTQITSNNEQANHVEKSKSRKILQKEIEELKEEIKTLKDELKIKNGLIDEQKLKIFNLQNELNNLKNINSFETEKLIISLKNELIEKKNEIIELKEKLSNISPSSLNNTGKNVFAINFLSLDQKINYPIVCNEDTLISRLEEELYNEYPEYKDFNTYLTTRGNTIKRFKTIKENGIKKGDKIIVNVYD